MAQNRLFEEVERTNSSPAAYNEDSFSFLNRAAGPYGQRVRTVLDDWYAVFPDTSADLWQRFRKPDPKQHYAAWWELYLHHIFTNLGFASRRTQNCLKAVAARTC